MPGPNSTIAFRRKDGTALHNREHGFMASKELTPPVAIHRYFVAFSHVYHFLRRSEVILYVNGQPVEQQQLIYPKLEVRTLFLDINSHHSKIWSFQAPVSMWIANHVEQDSRRDEKSTPFCGQMGKLFFFSEAITYSDVQTFYSMGPNFLPKKKSEYVREHFLLARNVLTLLALKHLNRYWPKGQRVLLRKQEAA